MITSGRTRSILSGLLVVAAAVVLLYAEIAVYSSRNVFDSERFADRAASALNERDVQEAIGAKIGSQLIEQVDPDLITVRPLIDAAATALVSTEEFRSLFRTGVAQFHSVITGKQDSAALALADIGVLMQSVIERGDPELAKQIPEQFSASLVTISKGEAATDVVRVQRTLRSAAIWAPILAAVLMAAAILLSPRWRNTIAYLGLAVALASALALVAYAIARSLFLNSIDDELDRRALGAVWNAMLGDFRNWNLVLTGTGVGVAAVAASVLKPFEVDEPVRRLVGGMTSPPSAPIARLAWAIGLVAVGIAAVVSPADVTQVLVVVGGVYLLFRGASELLRFTFRPPTATDQASQRKRRRHFVRLLITAAVLAGIVITVVSLSTGGKTDEVAGAKDACNGHPELCDKRLDEVALASTHNSFAAATDREWLFPEQDDSIVDQLDAGVRGFWIDLYYGLPGEEQVFTDTTKVSPKLQSQIEAELGPEFVEAADRIRSRISRPENTDPRVYMCHAFCELGALDAEKTFEQMNKWLDEHPKEVLVLDIEDYVSPEDAQQVLINSGLADHIYKGPVGPPWPTLRQMIDSDQRVLVVSENRQGGESWYHSFEKLFQETQFSFSKPSQMNCKPNRGDAGNSLFLINHWISTDPTPLISNSREVNKKSFLLDRARKCERNRKRFPNFLSVNFYKQGDLFDVVDELNGAG